MMSNLLEYFEALERLRNGAPVNVPKGTKITNDSVALEAGRKKGSIKKSRKAFTSLIEEIEKSKESKLSQIQMLETKLRIEKQKSEEYREKYEAVLAENLMLISTLNKLI
jgi:vacuolar-type H+-ATPase subunit I/STV1